LIGTEHALNIPHKKYFMMKKYLTFIVFIFPILANSQQIISVADTIYYQVDPSKSSKKIGEIRYNKKLDGNKKLTKADLFMRGKKSFDQLDSIRCFVYNSEWELISENTVKGENLTEFKNNDRAKNKSGKDFNLEESVITIKGRSQAHQQAKIYLKNNLPQNYLIKVASNSDNIEILEKERMFPNRSKIEFNLNVKIETGRHEYYLTFKNSNNESERVKIETIGYELMEMDFKEEKHASTNKEIILSNESDIYMEVLNNNKLLKIKGNEKEYNLGVSKITNKIDAKRLKKGIYNLELHNLGAKNIKYCKIKIE